MEHTTYSDEQIREVFDTFDTDGTDRLDMTELKNALNLLGIDLTDEEMKTLFNIDDDPESLSYEDFRSFIKDRIETMGIDFNQRVVDALEEFAEGGQITNELLKHILTARGNNPISEEEADELIATFDADANGAFDAKELADLLCAMNA